MPLSLTGESCPGVPPSTRKESISLSITIWEEIFSSFFDRQAYEAEDRHAVQDERWSVFTREQIVEKDNSWDLGLIRDDSVLDYNDQPDPVDSGEEAVDLLMSVVKELRALEVRDRWREKRKPNVFRALGGSISTRLGAAIQSTSELMLGIP